MGRDVVLVDSADETAFEVRHLLEGTALARDPRRGPAPTAGCRAATSPSSSGSAASSSAPSSTRSTPSPGSAALLDAATSERRASPIQAPPSELLAWRLRSLAGRPERGALCEDAAMTATRPDGRAADELRPITFERDFTDDGGGFVPRHLRRHAGAVHRVDRRGRAAVDARQGQGLGHRRVLDAPGLVARAHPARGQGRQAVGPHAGDPAAHRPVAAGGVRHARARRAPGHRRLRRAPGRRRHPHGVDLRRLRRPARRARRAWCRPGAIAQPPAHRVLRRHLGRASSTACPCSTCPTSRTRGPRST